MLEFVCVPWSEVCSARVTSLILLLLPPLSLNYSLLAGLDWLIVTALQRLRQSKSHSLREHPNNSTTGKKGECKQSLNSGKKVEDNNMKLCNIMGVELTLNQKLNWYGNLRMKSRFSLVKGERKVRHRANLAADLVHQVHHLVEMWKTSVLLERWWVSENGYAVLLLPVTCAVSVGGSA